MGFMRAGFGGFMGFTGFYKSESIVLTVIHTFGAVIEQLPLAIEIMVKCSHSGPSNKSVKRS